jgi:hypothetical protein
MRLILVALLTFCLQSPSSANSQKSQSQKQTEEGQHISEPTPATVNVTQVPPQAQKESLQANTYNWPEIASNWALVLIAAFAAYFGVKNLRAIESQVVEMRSTGQQTDKLIRENIAQSASLERSVAETARFASAMEGVAKSLEITAEASQQAAVASKQSIDSLRQQMRARLTVIIGGGVPQDREKNLKFEGRPTILNTGFTPARNVRTRTKSAILPIPLPADFDQSIASGEDEGGNFIGAHQNAQTSAVVEEYVPDEQVEDIKTGKGPGMYTWGFVTYEDVLGESHTTKFCHRLTYLEGNVFGYYIPGRNDAD